MLLIENPCYGIGDATVYAWVCHTLLAQGVSFRFNPYRHHGLIRMLSVPESVITTDEGPKTDKGGIANYHPPKGQFGGYDWLRCWIRGYGGNPDLPPVRPTLIPDPDRDSKMAAWWASRDSATSTKGRRVLIFPQVVWPVRGYPDSSFKWLAHNLMGSGYNPVVMLPSHNGPNKWPWLTWGHSLEDTVYAIKHADLVISVDTGPAHIAGTLNTPALVLVGPSPFDLFYGWYTSVRKVSSDLHCVGCNWSYDRGHRNWCTSTRYDGSGEDILKWEGCTALKSISPQSIFNTVSLTIGKT